MDRRVQRVVLLMEQDIRRSFTVDEIAQAVNLSPSLIYHLFRSEIGVSHTRYLKMLRVEKAKELLETTFMSVKEIVAAVGVNDGSHFVRDFKKQYKIVFANGGLTSTGGHPVRLYEDILSQNAYRGVAKGWFDGKAYFIIDSETDLQSKWPQIIADRPDFIKTYLLYSDEFEVRKADQTYYGRRGLDPRLLPLIVKRAHQDHLRVTAHIETASDFHNALIAGVDEINHLPGHYLPTTQPRSRFQISEEDARLAARRGVFVITTTIVGKLREKDPARLKLMQEGQIQNLRLLHGRGVPIAIGTDNYALTSLSEAMNLHEMKVFDNLTLLKLWCETTARAIFPGRKIGHLKKGYEASFLVLGGNPIESFDNVKGIKMRFKQGRRVTVETVGQTRVTSTP